MDERTLTERVQRIEQMLSLGGGAENPGKQSAVTQQRHVNEILSDRATDKLEMHRERATATPRATAFEEIMNRIHSGTERVHMIATGIEEIGNRVFGSVPQQADDTDAQNQRKPDGMLEHTFDVLNRLDYALSRLHSAAARIERI